MVDEKPVDMSSIYDETFKDVKEGEIVKER